MMPRWTCLIVLLIVAAPARAAEPSWAPVLTPAQRLALEEARRKNTRAEVQAAEKPTGRRFAT